MGNVIYAQERFNKKNDKPWGSKTTYEKVREVIKAAEDRIREKNAVRTTISE